VFLQRLFVALHTVLELHSLISGRGHLLVLAWHCSMYVCVCVDDLVVIRARPFVSTCMAA
jgi:hypothetical protein